MDEDGAGLEVEVGVNGGILQGPRPRQVSQHLRCKALLHMGHNVCHMGNTCDMIVRSMLNLC